MRKYRSPASAEHQRPSPERHFRLSAFVGITHNGYANWHILITCGGEALISDRIVRFLALRRVRHSHVTPREEQKRVSNRVAIEDKLIVQHLVLYQARISCKRVRQIDRRIL